MFSMICQISLQFIQHLLHNCNLKFLGFEFLNIFIEYLIFSCVSIFMVFCCCLLKSFLSAGDVRMILGRSGPGICREQCFHPLHFRSYLTFASYVLIFLLHLLTFKVFFFIVIFIFNWISHLCNPIKFLLSSFHICKLLYLNVQRFFWHGLQFPFSPFY